MKLKRPAMRAFLQQVLFVILVYETITNQVVLCDWALIKNSIGTESTVFKRDVNIATRADFALTSASTVTIPRARF
jgi:hypothetical protein